MESILLTERLMLRLPAVTDATAVASLMSPDVSQWLASWPPVVDATYATHRIIEAQAEVKSRRGLHWLVAAQGSQGVMGWIRVTKSELSDDRAELGFWLGSAFQDSVRERLGFSAGFMSSTEEL